MLSSTDSIAQLVAALAKAQVELVNPAKSLSAVMERSERGGEGQAYRYAPLSSGLDIARKTLGKHELAVIQTTHIERESGLVLLTSTLAHSSGEWMTTSWPVCRAADIQNPKQMGASLTYARRYSLFALIGLAGEDDLDASPLESSAAISPDPELNGAGRSGAGEAGPEIRRTRRRRSDAGRPRSASLPPDAPAGLRDGLDLITDAETLVRWAIDALPARNAMTDQERVAADAAFLARAEAIGADPELLLAFRVPPADPASTASASHA